VARNSGAKEECAREVNSTWRTAGTTNRIASGKECGEDVPEEGNTTELRFGKIEGCMVDRVV
jgi:hypothetical protein